MTSYAYDGVKYDLRAEYTDADGGRWRFTGKSDSGVPEMCRVNDRTDRRQIRTLPDIETNWGPLIVAPNNEGDNK